MFTSENFKFNLSSGDYQTLNEFAALDMNGLGIGTVTPTNRLSIFGETDKDVSMCIVAVGNDSFKSSGIWFGTHYSSNASDKKNKVAIICDETGTNGGGTAKLHVCLDDNTDIGDANLSNSKFTIQPDGNIGIGETAPDEKLVVAGGIKSDIKVTIINDDVSTILLDVSGTSAIRIPSGNNSNEKTSLVLNSQPGYLRYNTTLEQFEGYNGSNWTGLGGVISLDQNTRIEADNLGGLTFYESGNLRMTILGNNMGIGTTSNPTDTLEVNGRIRLSGSGLTTPTHACIYSKTLLVQLFLDICFKSKSKCD